MIFFKKIMKLSDFDFNLPTELIAQHPVSPRDHSKLLYIGNTLKDLHFYDILGLIKEGDVLVFNDTKVIPAKLDGYIINSLGQKSKVGINLHKKIDSNTWSIFAKPAKKLTVGSTIFFSDSLNSTVINKEENGEVIVTFSLEDQEFLAEIELIGSMPLPQYIRKGSADKTDNSNYQTVYAKNSGAVAAPTAGLHFTDELLNAIQNKGAKLAFVTLHVGAGTFMPVKTDVIDDHKMHSEFISLDSKNAEIIKSAKRVISVGTTSMRTLESIASIFSEITEYSGETDIFIKPGYTFKVVDILITNFHLPKSTLLILLSAFAGYEKVMRAYSHAISNQYRFFSYGDACWVERG